MSEPVLDADGRELKLGGRPNEGSPGYNPRCCHLARFIQNHKGDGPFGANPGYYACVCSGKSYCPDHGVRCNGSHE